MITDPIPTDTPNAVHRGAVRIGPSGIGSLLGAVVASALCVGAPFLTPPLAQAGPPVPLSPACDDYQFKGGSLRIELDDGATLTIPTSGRSMGPGQAVIQHTGGGAYGNASGGITGRTIDFTISNWNKGIWADKQTWFTGKINDDGSADGFYYVNTDGPGGWHIQGTLDCVAAPAAPIPGPAPMPKLPPPSPPTDAISVNFENIAGGVRVNVNNSSTVNATCTYDATAPNSFIPPFHKDFTVAANGGTHFDISAIPIGAQYDTVTACHGDFQGNDVQIGRVELTKQF